MKDKIFAAHWKAKYLQCIERQIFCSALKDKICAVRWNSKFVQCIERQNVCRVLKAKKVEISQLTVGCCPHDHICPQGTSGGQHCKIVIIVQSILKIHLMRGENVQVVNLFLKPNASGLYAKWPTSKWLQIAQNVKRSNSGVKISNTQTHLWRQALPRRTKSECQTKHILSKKKVKSDPTHFWKWGRVPDLITLGIVVKRELKHCLGLPYWHFQLVLSCYIHQLSFNNVSEFQTTRPIDRTRDWL